MTDLVAPVEVTARVNALAGVLDVQSWNTTLFEGTDHNHALPVLEAMYRYGLHGRYQPDKNQIYRDIEESIGQTWRSMPQAGSQVILAHYMLRRFNYKIEYLISDWSIQELEDEYRRIQQLSSKVATIGIAVTGVDLTATVASRATWGASRAGLITSSRVATVARIATPVGAATTVFSGLALGLTLFYFEQIQDKIIEELENRIDKDEYSDAQIDRLIAAPRRDR